MPFIKKANPSLAATTAPTCLIDNPRQRFLNLQDSMKSRQLASKKFKKTKKRFLKLLPLVASGVGSVAVGARRVLRLPIALSDVPSWHSQQFRWQRQRSGSHDEGLRGYRCAWRMRVARGEEGLSTGP